MSKKDKFLVKVHESVDVWNLDHSLAPMMVACLKLFKKRSVSFPYTYAADMPGKIYDDVENEWMPLDVPNGYSKKRWNDILDLMIWAFKQYTDDDNQPIFSSKLSDTEASKKQDVWEAKCRHGFELFGRYYTNLWI